MRQGARLGRPWQGLAVIGLAASLAATAPTGLQADELDTIEAGKLIVAFNGDMPGTGWDKEKERLMGLDGELMHWIADELGLAVEPALMEWAAEIASVKARRVDIMHGMMGWNEDRTKVINISDPIYYGKANITQKKSNNFTKISDLEGKTIATIQGFGWIDQLKKIPDTELKLYDTSDAAVRDLLAGRIDALFADPPLIQYAITKNPDWDIHALAIEDEFNPDYSLLTAKWNMVFGLSQEAPKLLAAFNEKIAEAWKSCKNVEIAKKYGLGDKSWFDPGPLNLRAGVDRPKDWVQHSMPSNCKPSS
ncbi:MAG: ABC transporter substrate-binding protein [Kiloniellales bacterium]|nr:ABC transporter substrate-binding protein [Kiloniellales bacterium]